MTTPEYPTDEQLEKIKEWDSADYHGLMGYVKSLWAPFGAFQLKEDDIYILATGGWSGNEDIISALQDNQLFWMIFWEESSRGGRHIFAPCTLKTIEEIEELRSTNQLRIT